ncbi:hypothetical protein EVG20_g10838 [Dentipellis fragilis]|uniref:Uncharacterized protein n=1 Tax=Dentipellis fragilis TaxID=205917 RepID=A0A4Y9XQX3_9AGAM|nr:hypothetical protein EVG20_g10838 [Dentipellis fragilis]
METSMNKASALKRANTGMGPSLPAARSTGALLNRAKSTNGIPPSARYQNNSYLIGRPWNDTADHDEHSFVEDEEDEEYDDREWGLEKDMELFEVSAKNDQGIEDLFDSLISAIISKKDVIEQENEMKRRDSVFLTSVVAPTWAAQADEEEAREKAAARFARIARLPHRCSATGAQPRPASSSFLSNDRLLCPLSAVGPDSVPIGSPHPRIPTCPPPTTTVHDHYVHIPIPLSVPLTPRWLTTSASLGYSSTDLFPQAVHNALDSHTLLSFGSLICSLLSLPISLTRPLHSSP